MDLILQYLFCGVVVMFFFEIFKKYYMPDTKTTYIEGVFGIVFFPLMLLAFVVGFISSYINSKNK